MIYTKQMSQVDSRASVCWFVISHIIFPSIDVFSDVALAARLWNGPNKDQIMTTRVPWKCPFVEEDKLCWPGEAGYMDTRLLQ